VQVQVQGGHFVSPVHLSHVINAGMYVRADVMPVNWNMRKTLLRRDVRHLSEIVLVFQANTRHQLQQQLYQQL
jgi:hypothetical protein